MRQIDVFNTHAGRRPRRTDIRTLVDMVLKKQRCRSAVVTVVFVDDIAMKRMNRRYLNHNVSTDVLAFPLGEQQSSRVEGEVYVNLDRAYTQAADYNVSFRSEVGRLVIHGVLHLLGYDDATEHARREMSGLEDRYLAIQGLL